jgi:hypothetical protein
MILNSDRFSAKKIRETLFALKGTVEQEATYGLTVLA